MILEGPTATLGGSAGYLHAVVRDLRTFLECASCRFAALYFIPFFTAVVLTGQATFLLAAFGAVYWLLTSLAIEATNRLSDRREDAVNSPTRTSLCAGLGWRKLEIAERTLWGALLALDVCWVMLDGNVVLALLLGGAMAMGISYSRGPRLARRGLLPFVTLSMLFGGAFFLGWATGDPLSATGWEQLGAGLPLISVIGFFVVAFAGIKDITDTEGDVRIGYHSHFVKLVEQHGTATVIVLATLPFVAVVVLVASGLLPTRLLGLLAFAPVSLTLALAVGSAGDEQARMAVRERFYLSWLLFSSIAVLLFLPEWELAAAVAAGCAYWMAATRYLHWTDVSLRGRLRHLLAVPAGPQGVGRSG